MNTPTCLIVDDEADIRELLVLTLTRMQVETDSAGSVFEAKSLLGQRDYDLCLTDMRLPDGEGLQLVRHIGQSFPRLPVAVITAYGSAENAVQALKAGAFDYLSKPISLKQLRSLVASALRLKETIQPSSERQILLGQSSAICKVRSTIEKLARSQAPVHIYGESGTGKELAARLIHDSGSRHGGPFVPVNCGAIPENLMESEFFGYRKGAFTGAQQDHEGFFQAANGGTLFLDEVADLPMPMQVKLLRAIQEKKVRKIGNTEETNVDIRIISATHQNLSDMLKNGQFRQDLYYRLNVIDLEMPALRNMSEDIPDISERLLEKISQELDVKPPTLDQSAIALLQQHSFPGNVRELENILERALALCDNQTITADDLSINGRTIDELSDPSNQPLPDYLESIEKQAMLDALEKTGHNKTEAARLLGVSFRNFRYRYSKLGMDKQ